MDTAKYLLSLLPPSTPTDQTCRIVISADCLNHRGTKRPMQWLVVQERYQNYQKGPSGMSAVRL